MPPSFRSNTTIRLGHLGSADAAPLLVAQRHGYFSDEGLSVDLTGEIGFAALSAKLADRRLDGACLPAQMHVLLSLGAGVPRVPMEAALVCAYQDLAIVCAPKESGAPGKNRAPVAPLKLGLVTPGTPARLMLQRWLQLDFPDAPLEPVYVPLAASQLVDFFREDVIDGFCAPESVAVKAAAESPGALVVASGGLFPLHPGGAVALRQEFSQAHPAFADGLARALLRARRHCAEPAHANELANLAQTYPSVGDPQKKSATDIVRLPVTPVNESRGTRFDGPTLGTGLDADGVSFLEKACQAALGGGRRFDFKSEIVRVFKLPASLSVVRSR